MSSQHHKRIRGLHRSMIPEAPPSTVAFILIIVSSLARLGAALLLQRNLDIAIAELVLNGAFLLALHHKKAWGRTGLIFVAMGNLIYFAAQTFFHREVLVGLLEVSTSLAILLVLVGRPSVVRATSGLVIYFAGLAAFGNLLALRTLGHAQVPQVVAEGPHYDGGLKAFRSDHGYTLSLAHSPWQVVPPQQAAELIGMEVKEADVFLARSDGGAFGLVFPLNFNNLPYSPELAQELQSEIQNRWLADLTHWELYSHEDGFVLTAQGEINHVPLNYAVLYKHFGNLGVYAIFWSDATHEQQLLSEVNGIFSEATALSLKERLVAYTPADVYKMNSDAVVLIHVYDKEKNLIGRGSGFNISPDGLVITNLHVMAQGDRGDTWGDTVEVVFPKEGAHKEVLIVGLSGQDTDLAILSLQGHNLPIIRSFKSVDVVPGDIVYVIGNPKGLVNSVSEGIIGGVREDQAMTLYQITAPISSGSSGGPVFNHYGEVIGVANSVVKDAQNLNFSISIDELEKIYFLPQPVSLRTLMDMLHPDPVAEPPLSSSEVSTLPFLSPSFP